MGGVSIGSLIGPPIGGALFARFGYRGPFVVCLAATVIDLIARLLIIERKEALQYGMDPHQFDESEDGGKGKSGNKNSVLPDEFKPVKEGNIPDTIPRLRT
ncbi:hypothetical protein C0995_007501, partial [Termitomyces sp. Mi166